MVTAAQAFQSLQRDLEQLVPGVQARLAEAHPGRYGYLIVDTQWGSAVASLAVSAALWETPAALRRDAEVLRDALHWQREQALRAGREREEV